MSFPTYGTHQKDVRGVGPKIRHFNPISTGQFGGRLFIIYIIYILSDCEFSVFGGFSRQIFEGFL